VLTGDLQIIELVIENNNSRRRSTTRQIREAFEKLRRRYGGLVELHGFLGSKELQNSLLFAILDLSLGSGSTILGNELAVGIMAMFSKSWISIPSPTNPQSIHIP
jgi:hypothetical protein